MKSLRTRGLLIFAVLCFCMTFSISAKAAITRSVTSYGAVANDKGDDTQAFMSAFAKTADEVKAGSSKMLTVKIPAGTYYVNKNIKVYSYTNVQADPKTVIISTSKEDESILTGAHYDSNGYYCAGIDKSCKHGGYSQNAYITITGGSWDRNDINGVANSSVFSFRHANHITIKNLSVKNGTSHLINLSGNSDAYISGVTASNSRDYKGTSKNYWAYYTNITSAKTHAIRHRSIEVMHFDYMAAGEPEYYPSDGTPCKNVTVTNCTFNNVYAGIGTHHINSQKGSNFTFTNNTFNNTAGIGIHVYSYNNVKVSGNIFNNCYQPLYASDSTVTFSNNKMTNSDAIPVYLTNKSKGTITSNTISKTSKNVYDEDNPAGIRLKDAAMALVHNNTVSNTLDAGISISASTDTCTVSVTGNKITNTNSNGIRLEGKCKVEKVDNNTIDTVKDSGIVTKDVADVTITNNKINKAQLGIYLQNAKTASVTKNTVTNGSGHALYVNSNSASKTCAKISYNTLKSLGKVKNIRFKGYCTNCVLQGNQVGAGGFLEDSTCKGTVHKDGSGLTTPGLKQLAAYKNAVSVKWSRVNNATGYYIYRRTGKGKFAKIGTASASASSYLDKKAKNGVVYDYTVQAYNKSGKSKYNTKGKRILFLRYPALSTKLLGKKSLRLSWKKNAAAQGYQVSIDSVSNKFKNAKTYTLKGSAKCKEDFKNLKLKGTYYVRVRSFKSSGGKKYYSDWSGTKTVVIKK